MWENKTIKGGRERQTEVGDSTCINLLFITPHVEDASFSLKEKSEQQVIKCTLLPFCVCTVKSTQSTLHSWDVPPSPNAQTFPPVSRRWGKLQPRHSKTFKGNWGRACGSVNTLECSRAKPLSGQTSRRWFLWRPLPVHLNNSLYTWTKQHFYMSIEGRGKNAPSTRLPRLTRPHRQADWQAGEQARSGLPFIWWGSLLVSGRWRPPRPSAVSAAPRGGTVCCWVCWSPSPSWSPS